MPILSCPVLMFFLRQDRPVVKSVHSGGASERFRYRARHRGCVHGEVLVAMGPNYRSLLPKFAGTISPAPQSGGRDCRSVVSPQILRHVRKCFGKHLVLETLG